MEITLDAEQLRREPIINRLHKVTGLDILAIEAHLTELLSGETLLSIRSAFGSPQRPEEGGPAGREAGPAGPLNPAPGLGG